MIASWITMIWLKWKTLLHRRRLDRDLEAELRFHLDARTEMNLAHGMSADNALKAAHRQFGNPTFIRESCRELWSFIWIESLWRDICYAVRSLVKSPTFTFAAVLSLGLGIGVNVAVFSLVNAVALRTLPVPHPEQLVILTGSENGDKKPNFLAGTFSVLNAEQHVLAGLCASGDLSLRQVRVAGSPEPLAQVAGKLVSENYFTVLGVGAIRGRFFDAGENAHAVAVISSGFWKQQFQSAPNAIGSTIGINGTAVTIIGVTPADFFGESVGTVPDIWLPLGLQRLAAGPILPLRLLGRRAMGISDAQAAAVLTTIYQNWEDSQPLLASRYQANRAKIRYHIIIEPGSQGLEDMREKFSKPLWMLMGIVGLILLLTCCNLASLLMARAAARRHEFGLRIALGASRRRIVQQLLIESMLTAGLGGGVGVGVAALIAPLLLRLFSDRDLPYVVTDTLDLRVLAFAICLCALSSLLFGLFPALHATKVDVNSILKGNVGNQLGTLRSQRVSKGLVVVQVASSLVLLVAALLLIRSLYGLYHIDSGFRRENLVLVKVPMSTAVRLQANLQTDLLQRTNTIPGVRNAGLAMSAPLVGPASVQEVTISGQANGQRVGVNYISPGYFQTVGTNLLQGRDFGQQDAPNSPKVAIVNRTIRERYFAGQSPIGRQISLGSSFNSTRALEIIGVAEDAKYDSLRMPNQPFVFVPLAQATVPVFYVVIRSVGDPNAFLATLRRTFSDVAPELSASEITTMEQRIDRTLVKERSMTDGCLAFGLLALILTCVGLYGTVSYGLAQRIPEFGLRMALGASPADAMRLVLREALLLLAAGFAMGIPAAIAASRLLRNLVFGLTTVDPTSYAAASAVLILVALGAAYLPAHRASKVDPIVALRNE